MGFDPYFLAQAKRNAARDGIELIQAIQLLSKEWRAVGKQPLIGDLRTVSWHTAYEQSNRATL